MHSRSFAGAQSVPPEHFVLFLFCFFGFFGLLRSSVVGWLQLTLMNLSSSQQMQPTEKKQARLRLGQLFSRNKKKIMSP